jgi:peptide/nickel transport system substrate-binding protein
VVENGVGLATNGWGADWNDGFGMLSQIVDSRVIRATGGSSNLSVRIPRSTPCWTRPWPSRT